MYIVGMTGGIGCGKSTVAKLFQNLGVPVIDADQIARDLVEPGNAALTAIVEHFGSSILTDDGYLNRAYLRKIIFDDAKKRKTLEEILHPRIRNHIHKWIEQQSTPYCLIVIPLLFETGWDKSLDRILVIDADRQTQLSRTASRDKICEDEVDKIISSQIDRDTRLQRADDVINNNYSLEELKNEVSRLHDFYIKVASE